MVYFNLAAVKLHYCTEVTAVKMSHGSIGMVSRKEFRYLNHSVRRMTVVDRQAMNFTIPPRENRYDVTYKDNCLYVIVEWTIDREAALDPLEELNQTYGCATPEAKALSTQYFNRGPSGITCVYTLQYTIRVDDLAAAGGSLYIQNLDIVVSLDGANAPHHPASLTGGYEQAIDEDSMIDRTKLGHKVWMVASQGGAKRRYVNLGGVVHEVPIIRDPQQRDGLYCVSSRVRSNEVGGDGCVYGYVPFSEIDTSTDGGKVPKTYAKFSDAQHNGKANEELEENILKLKYDTKIAEFMKLMEKLKMEQEADKLKYEHELNKLRQENAALSKKEIIEWLKYVPAVIASVTAIIAVIRK